MENNSPLRRVVLLGIGNELNGDDAAGMQFVRLLQENMLHTSAFLFLEGGTAPENLTGAIRKFQPDLVVMVDAAQLGLQPGEMALLNPDDIEGITASTHTFPLSMLAEFIRQEMGCRVQMIGIQPKASNPFSTISEPVEASINDLAQKFLDQITG